MPAKKGSGAAATAAPKGDGYDRPDVEGVERDQPNLPELAPPSEEYLQGLVKEKEIQFSSEDTAIQEFRKLVNRLRPTNIPEKYRHTDWDFRSSDLGDEIDRIVSLVTSKDPCLTVTALRQGDGPQLNATKRKNHTEPAMHFAFRRAQGVDAWRTLVKAVAGDGAGVSKMVYRPDLWQERYSLRLNQFDDDEGYGDKPGAKSRERKFLDTVDDAKKASGPPVAIVNIDLASWYPVWDDLDLAESLEITERPTHEVLRKYRLNLTGKKLSPSEELSTVGPPLTNSQKGKMPNTLKVIEHWDDTYCTVAVMHGGSVVIADQYKHGYGRLPVFFTPGRNYVRGTKHGQSLVDAQAPYVELLNYFTTIAVNVAAVAAAPPIFHTLPEGTESWMGETGTEEGKDGPAPMQRWEGGTIYHGRPGESFQEMKLPQISSDLNQIIGSIKEERAKVAMPRASSAIGGDLEGAGFALAQILADIRAEKADVLDALCNTLEDMTRFYWHLLSTVVGEAVYVEGLDPTDPKGKTVTQVALKPADLATQVKISWDIDWSQDAQKMVLMRMVHERVAAQTLNRDKAIEMLGDNPDEVRLGILTDWVREQPEYRRQALKSVFQQIGQGDLVASASEQIASDQMMDPMAPSPGSTLATPGAQTATQPPRPGGGMPGNAGVGPDQGAAIAGKGRQAAGVHVNPGPARGSMPGAIVAMPRPGQATV